MAGRGKGLGGSDSKEDGMKSGFHALILLGALLLGLAAAANASAPRVIMIEDFDAIS